MRIKKTAIAIMMFSAIAMIAGVNFAGAQVYVPLVQIPGLPPGAVNLSMYLVGLYDFLLSIVGIVAVMMLIIGGMRYITAAGNQAAVSDAKDIITNALAGLLLAILSWVIVAEINPDVLYIKKPGAGFTSEDNVDWGKCGQYDPDMATCICKDTVDISAAAITSQELCDRECRLQDHCMIEGAQCFIREDINGPNFYSSSDNEALGQDGECYCVLGTNISPVAGIGCDSTCENDCSWDISGCTRIDVFMGTSFNSCYIPFNHLSEEQYSFPIGTTLYYRISIYDPQGILAAAITPATPANFALDANDDAVPNWTIAANSLDELNNKQFSYTHAVPNNNPLNGSTYVINLTTPLCGAYLENDSVFFTITN